jgi:hypothetical protein
MRALQNRLQKLESTLRNELDDKDLSPFIGFMWFAVTYYLGKPSRGEKLIAAYARALGYANESEFNYAVALDQRGLRQRGRPGVRQRESSAQDELWKKFDILNSRTDNDEKRFEAFTRMEAGLPKSYKDRLETILKRTDIRLERLRFHSRDFGAYVRCFA